MTVIRPVGGYKTDLYTTIHGKLVIHDAETQKRWQGGDNQVCWLDSCSPVIDAAPDSVVLICDLFDPPGVIGRILMQEMSRQLIEPCHCCLASTQVLQEGLKTG